MPSVTGNDVGRAVRGQRNALGLRVEDLAVRSGVAYRTIIRVEAGHDVTLSTLSKIAAGLEVSVHDLLTKDPAA